MPITINGSGTVTGISAGGLPDGVIKAPDLDGAQTGTAPIYGCRAWVCFNGMRNEADTGGSTNGANVKIRSSGNVSSVLKNDVGDYTITFTTALPNLNYSITYGGMQDTITAGAACFVGIMTNSGALASKTTSTVRIHCKNQAFAPTDGVEINIAVFC